MKKTIFNELIKHTKLNLIISSIIGICTIFFGSLLTLVPQFNILTRAGDLFPSSYLWVFLILFLVGSFTTYLFLTIWKLIELVFSKKIILAHSIFIALLITFMSFNFVFRGDWVYILLEKSLWLLVSIVVFFVIFFIIEIIGDKLTKLGKARSVKRVIFRIVEVLIACFICWVFSIALALVTYGLF